MTRILPRILVAAAALVVVSAAAQPQNPFAGRWDVTTTAVASARNPNPPPEAQWMEIVTRDGQLAGRIQPTGGAVRDIVSAAMDGPQIEITVTAATATRPATTWALTPDANGHAFTGVQKTGDTVTAHLAGVRAPALDRTAPAAWSDPQPLFDGKDLTGWEVVSNPERNKWVVRDGELVNDNPNGGAANLRTVATFDDFKLHIEVNCPPGGNSGIYLRGRYEIQVGTEGGTQPSHEMGAIYGFFAPAAIDPVPLGEWSRFDVTFVGRTVTVVRDGVLIHDRRELPGITGGALDSHEGEPGPLMLQGDHEGVLHFRNITIQTPAR